MFYTFITFIIALPFGLFAGYTGARFIVNLSAPVTADECAHNWGVFGPDYDATTCSRCGTEK